MVLVLYPETRELGECTKGGGGGGDISGVLERDDAAEGDEQAGLQTTINLSGAAGETVQHGSLGHPFGIEDVKEVVPGVAGVDDQGQGVRVGQRDLCREGGALHVTRRMLVEVVQP